MNYPKSYFLSSEVYLDQYLQCYKNIITINLFPEGPLKKIVRQIQTPPLSTFQVNGPCNPLKKCTLALLSPNMNNGSGSGSNCGCLMTEDEIPDLYSFLLSHGYKIDNSFTKMMNAGEVRFNNKKIVFFFTYVGDKG